MVIYSKNLFHADYMNKIYVSIGNGLGNQMFEYALFLGLKKKYKNTCVTTRLIFAGKKTDNRLTEPFGIELANNNESLWIKKRYPLKTASYKSIIKSVLYNVRGTIIPDSLFKGEGVISICYRDGTLYREEVYSLEVDKHSYLLQSSFVNPEYFKPVAEQIRDVYRFRISDEFIKRDVFYDLIQASNSVSIHVRRGDYIKDGIYYLLDRKYYNKAINYINKRVSNPQFFVFSDDVTYAKKMFSEYKDFNYVTNEKNKDYEDMYLMSCCKHNIIANSSFSFWGAYLGVYKKKIVVAPNKICSWSKNGIYCNNWYILNIEEL